MEYKVDAIQLTRGKGSYWIIALHPDQGVSILMRAWETPKHGFKAVIWTDTAFAIDRKVKQTLQEKLDDSYVELAGSVINGERFTLRELMDVRRLPALWRHGETITLARLCNALLHNERPADRDDEAFADLTRMRDAAMAGKIETPHLPALDAADYVRSNQAVPALEKPKLAALLAQADGFGDWA